jgi:predicted dehydrogenase
MKENTMPERPLRIGLWGCGKRTRSLVEDAANQELATVTCVYDLNTATAETLADEYHAKAVTSEDALLEGEDVDAFLICLYPGLHARALLKALPVGKPIYIEKPVATTWEDFALVTQAARDCTAPIHVGLGHRYFPVFSTLTQLVQQGKIGDLVSIAANWLTTLAPIETFPGGRENWHFREDTGGELIQHFCHAFDWLRDLGGEFCEISAMSNHTVHTDIPIEDTWNIGLRYASGALVNFHSSMNNPRKGELGWIEGSTGALEWEWNNPSTIRFYVNTYPRTKTHEDIPLEKLPYSAMTRPFASFCESITTGSPCEIDIWDGLWASYIPLMAKKSAQDGCKLQLKQPSEW